MLEELYKLQPGERLLYSVMIGGAVLLPFALWKWVFSPKYYLRFKERPNSFSPFDFILLLLIWWFMNGILGQLVSKADAGWKTLYSVTAILAAQVIVIPLEVYICKRRFNRGLGEGGLGLTTKNFYTTVMLAVACVIIVLPPCNILASAMTYWLKQTSYQIQEHVLLQDMMKVGLGGKIIIVVSSIIGAPIFEELFFRGIFQSMLRRVLSPWLAVVITGVLFMLVHREIQNWPSLFLLALALGWAYEKTGRILLPVLIHALFNAIYLGAYIMGMPKL